jgi:aspartyl protease family protein
MKVITIGRDTNNDVVISDAKASRHHLQIIQDKTNYRIVDLGSKNGTFVNNRKISSETTLFAGDSVCIGNTTLPWQTYFIKRKYINQKYLLVGISGIVAVLAMIVLYMLVVSPDQKTVVKMDEKYGVRYVPMKINGQELNFVFDTGASSICISVLEASVLVKNGTLRTSDIIGEEEFITANGDISVGAKINLKTVQIGNRKLSNIEATIIENPQAECLLGQTVLSQFGKYTIDNQKNEIIFE